MGRGQGRRRRRAPTTRPPARGTQTTASPALRSTRSSRSALRSARSSCLWNNSSTTALPRARAAAGRSRAVDHAPPRRMRPYKRAPALYVRRSRRCRRARTLRSTVLRATPSLLPRTRSTQPRGHPCMGSTRRRCLAPCSPAGTHSGPNDCPERRAIAAPCHVGAATRRRRPLVLLPLLLLVLLVECTIRPV